MSEDISSSYLAHGVEDWPTALFFHDGAATRDKIVRASVINKKRFRAQLDESDIENLSWRPHQVAELMHHGRLTPSELNALLGRSFPLLFRVLLQRYESFAPDLEKRLYSDLESVERLVSFLHREGKRGLMDEPFYAALLEGDPNRSLRIINDPDTRAFRRDMLMSSAEAMRCTSAAWAFFYLRANVIDTLPAELVPVLQKSEEYSYFAARLLRDRHAISADYAVLLQNLKEPRWIYHALRDGLGGDTVDLVERLLGAPAWLVQYLARSRMDIGQKEEMYQRAIVHLSSLGKSHPLASDMHLWFESLTLEEATSFMTAA
jgi:hypothetical protein